MNKKPEFKYNEGNILQYISNYILATYSQHYVGKSSIQAIDVWKTLDIDSQSFQSNIIKYAMRYGHKDGLNLKDLMKIIHYTILLIDRNHSDEILAELQKSNTPMLINFPDNNINELFLEFNRNFIQKMNETVEADSHLPSANISEISRESLYQYDDQDDEKADAEPSLSITNEELFEHGAQTLKKDKEKIGRQE